MRTFTGKKAEKTAKVLLKHGRSIKGLRSWVLRHLVMALLAIFLIGITAPVNAAPRAEKGRKSSCHHKVITRTIPVIITKKKNPVMKKMHGNNTRTKRYCFPA
jgi:hypothetical protein